MIHILDRSERSVYGRGDGFSYFLGGGSCLSRMGWKVFISIRVDWWA